MQASGALLTFAGWLRPRISEAIVDRAAALGARSRLPAVVRRERIARENIVHLTGEADSLVQRRLARRTMRNFLRCQADVLTLASRPVTALQDTLTVTGLDRLERALAFGRGAIVVGPHLGNFELGILGRPTAVPALVLVEAIDPARDAWMAAVRSRTGHRVMAASPAGLRESLRALHRGEIVFVAGDRGLRSTARLTVAFARGRRPVPMGPAWLAVRSGAPVLIAATVLSGRADRPYHATVEGPISTDDLRSDAVAELTRRIGFRLGALAAEYPDQWFVFDPEWDGPVAPAAV